MRLILDLYVALIGLVTGSYLNVLIHRLPRGLSTVLPRSRCPHCQTKIRARDNIPLLSYLLLRGRCRGCGTPISWRYPFVEALTAVSFVAALERFGLTAAAGVAAVFCAMMLALAAIDLEHFLLPDRITWPGIAFGLGAHLAFPGLPWTDLRGAVLGALLGGAVLLAVTGVWYLARRVHAMGLGDAKMLAMIGAFVGWKGVIATLFLASLAGTLVGITQMLRRRMTMRSALPFGVFLAVGGVVTLFFGTQLTDAYRVVLP